MNIGVIGYQTTSILDELFEADFINEFPEVSPDALIVLNPKSVISDVGLMNFICTSQISHIFISANLNIFSFKEDFDISEFKKMLGNQLHVFWEVSQS